MLVICPHCAKPHEVEAEKVVVRPTDEELIESISLEITIKVKSVA